ncbi:MAG: Ig-like domain-containing protein [Oscillospiraceae bacterium]|nr:Ig-like domain-containing protein [Oscillospiraceae bacterium]
MKRFLSIILALALVIAMIPATFAAEGEAVELNPVYSFSKTAIAEDYKDTVGVDPIKVTSYDMIDTTKSSGQWFWRSAFGIRTTKALYDDQMTTSVTISSLSSNAIILQIKVDKAGVYVPGADFLSSTSTGLIDMYLVHTDDFGDNVNVTTVNAAIATASYDADATVMHAISVDTNSASENPKNEKAPKLSLKQGDYYLFIVTSSGAKASTHASGYEYAQIKYLSLTRQPWVSLSVESSEIEAGSSTKLTAIAENADATAADAEISYSASPADVVSIDAEGNVTGIKAGNATITAKATIGGVEYSDSVTIKVNPLDKTHKFVFNNTMLSDETLAAATEDGAYRTKDQLLSTTRDKNTGAAKGEEFIDEYSDFDTAKGTDKWAYTRLGGMVYMFPGYVQFYTYKIRFGNNAVSVGSAGSPNINTRFVFQIEVKHPGVYDISADMYNLLNGSEADVYIVKKSEVDASPLLGEWAGYKRMTVDYLKTLPVDGRISNIGVNKTTSADYICTKELEKGDYYIILHTNSDSSYDTQLLCIKSITMTESDGEITAPETPVNAKDTVSFGTNIGGSYATKTVNRGETVELSAPETDNNGNVFKCWVKGTEKNGVWVSSKASDTYKVMTNTYLTAVYEAPSATEGKVVEFYKENGEYFTTVAAVDGKAVLPTENPSLPGYDFAGWYVSEEDELVADEELTADVTRAVAKFNGKTVLTATMVKVNGEQSTECNFGTLISAEDSKAKYWLRDGKIVKFGTNYDYYIWDATNIMSSYDSTTAIRPTVVLDKYSVDGAYMIEYDRGNQTIAEVGILFGSSEKMTVDSCNSKATSQWNRAHGQFSATPYGDEAYARGYMIYGTAGNYKVIYTDAIEIQ